LKKIFSVITIAAIGSALLAGCGSKVEPKPEPAPAVSVAPVATPHPDYVKYKDLVSQLKAEYGKYEDVNLALADGYVAASKFVPLMGYHFVNPKLTDYKKPSVLTYVLDGEKFKLIAVEYSTVDPKVPTPFPELKWALSHEASAHYADGTELPVKNPKEALAENPATKAKFSTWHPNLYSIHAYVFAENPEGLFAELNPLLEKYNKNPLVAPTTGYGIEAK
jgi:hypothetical protein